MSGVTSTIWTCFDQHIDTVLSGCHSTIGCICSCLEGTSTPFSRTVNFLDVSQATSLRQPDTMLERK